jgi:hypothetical protein
MRRVAATLAACAVAFVVAFVMAWLIGSRLAVAHRVELSRTLEAPVEQVWDRIENVGAWTAWRADLDSVEVVGDQEVRIVSRGDAVRYRIVRPAQRVLVTEIVDAGLPYGGRWVWSVAPAAEGAAIVTIVEEGEVYDPLFRFFSRFVFGHRATIRGVLDQLERSFPAPGR